METVKKLCPKCQNYIISEDGCPICDFGGASNSNSINTGIVVPSGDEKKSEAKKVIKENGENVDYDTIIEETKKRLDEKKQEVILEKGKEPHQKYRFAHAIYEVRKLITDNSRGVHSKRKYDGKSKQQVFDERIQKIGKFYREFDMRFVYSVVLSGITKTDSFRSKVSRYLRRSSSLEAKKTNETGVYNKKIYRIKNSEIRTRRIQFEGKTRPRNKKYRSEAQTKRLERMFRDIKRKFTGKYTIKSFRGLRGLF